jgi:hypothetical protein
MAPDRVEYQPAGLPETCPIAFKEWAGVCAALAEGRQSLIVRKGGIAEGPRGFLPEHSIFWLYPTYVHQAQQGLRTAQPTDSQQPPGTVALSTLAVVDSISFVEHEETLAALEPLHVWTEETLKQRFHYRKPGLWVLGVRVFRRDHPHRLEVTPEHAGCKTWVELDPPLATDGCAAVLGAEEFSRQRTRLQAALAAAGDVSRADRPLES